MESSLTPGSIAALFGSMAVLAFIPGISVLVVSARSAANGFTHGVFVTIGIVTGDIIFIILAIYGLSVLAEFMGSHFSLIKYLGSAYLIWLGINLWKFKPGTGEVENNIEPSILSSFLTGLFITLGDQKAILFYLGFFQVTDYYQNRLDLKPPLMVAFFLAGLMIHGTLQEWWIVPSIDIG